MSTCSTFDFCWLSRDQSHPQGWYALLIHRNKNEKNFVSDIVNIPICSHLCMRIIPLTYWAYCNVWTNRYFLACRGRHFLWVLFVVCFFFPSVPTFIHHIILQKHHDVGWKKMGFKKMYIPFTCLLVLIFYLQLGDVFKTPLFNSEG